MDATRILALIAAACVVCAVVAAVLLTVALDRRGYRTPAPLLGALLPRNLNRYAALTRMERGRVGPLFYLYVIPINAALVLALVIWLVAG